MTTSEWSGREMLADVGEVCVQATWLEYALVELVALAEDRDGQWCTDTMAEVGGPIVAARKAVANGSMSELNSSLVGNLVERAKMCLEKRHKIVHSVALTTDDGRFAGWWHPRSDDERPLSKEELASVAGELYFCYVGFHIFVEAMRKQRAT